MENFRIYLGGGVTGLTFEEANGWREWFEKNVGKYSDKAYCKAVCINPMKYYNFNMNPESYTQREIMDFDLSKVRSSNLMVVNFNSPKSLGTSIEMAIAYDRKIPILGLRDRVDCENEEWTASNIYKEIYPWQEDMCLKMFDTIDELVDYVINYFLS